VERENTLAYSSGASVASEQFDHIDNRSSKGLIKTTTVFNDHFIVKVNFVFFIDIKKYLAQTSKPDLWSTTRCDQWPVL
jgi:hypothetical protein